MKSVLYISLEAHAGRRCGTVAISNSAGVSRGWRPGPSGVAASSVVGSPLSCEGPLARDDHGRSPSCPGQPSSAGIRRAADLARKSESAELECGVPSERASWHQAR